MKNYLHNKIVSHWENEKTKHGFEERAKLRNIHLMHQGNSISQGFLFFPRVEFKYHYLFNCSGIINN